MMPLMPLLDCLQSDGSLDLSAIPSEYRVVQIGTLSGDRVKMMCTKAAAVIKAKFATPPLMCEKKYFTFPSKPDLSTKNTERHRPRECWKVKHVTRCSTV
ncbi:hypothetical protein JG687_00005317 [Phytophthora cactorum]|uniref:Uncharacterized protein n=2 Tax=Phytophthora TaxID=4783 RepID=A0A8J5IRS5_9STRA|nr:hypothetical protein PC128_g8917 [Phytophthora cactorum]KAG6961326.1 hypothetical protein JG688_00009169 [Phytophthora aleatoria]KAG6965649.1 hypothetical protein JG687_00005317 [Phytophthora cactorum]